MGYCFKNFEILHHNKLLHIVINSFFYNGMVLIDNVIYILDKRGLFYIDSINNTIEEFGTKGLIASDIYQIIPKEESLLIWTNSMVLWEYRSNTWTKLGSLPYSTYPDAKHKTTITKLLENNFGSDEDINYFTKKIDKYDQNDRVIKNGYITYSQNKVALCIFGKLFIYNGDSKVFNLKEIKYQNIDNTREHYIVEALYDLDDNLVIGIESQSQSTYKKSYTPVVVLSSGYKPYTSIQYTNLPSLHIDINGKLFCDSIPMSLTLSKNGYEQSSNDYLRQYSVFSSSRRIKAEKSFANGKITVAEYFRSGCPDAEYFKFYKIAYNNEPIESINMKFTTLYDDKKNTLFIGTAGSGLLKIIY